MRELAPETVLPEKRQDTAQGAGRAFQQERVYGWERPLARVGESITLSAKLVGFQAGTPVTFQVFHPTAEPGRPMASLRGRADSEGVATAEWLVRVDPRRSDDPRLVFEASAEGYSNFYPALLVCDTVEMVLRAEDGTPLANAEVRVADSSGAVRTGYTSSEGFTTIDPVSVGLFTVSVKGYVIEGERSPGEKKFETGVPLELGLVKIPFALEFESPRRGEVYLVGDEVPLVARVLADTPTPPRGLDFEARGTPTARVADGDRGPVLLVGSDDGEIEVVVRSRGAKASVRIQVVRPRLRGLTFLDNAGNLLPLFDWKTGELAAPTYRFDEQGRALGAHPGAFLFGTALALRAEIDLPEKVVRPVRVAVLGATGPIEFPEDPARPTAGEARARRIFFASATPTEGGACAWDGEAPLAVDLVASTPLPPWVRDHDIELDIRITTPTPGSTLGAEDLFEEGLPVAPTARVRAIAIFGKPTLADGKVADLAVEPIAPCDFDAFHVGQAARWADRAWNLLGEGEGSIPRRIQRALTHYRWPEEYEGKDGRRRAEHPRPKNATALEGDGVYPGGGQACGSCGGALANGVCSACARRAAVELRCAACGTGVRGGHGCPKCGIYFLRWGPFGYEDGHSGCGFGFGGDLTYEGGIAGVVKGPGFGGAVLPYVPPLTPASEKTRRDRRVDFCPACRGVRAFAEARCRGCGAWVDERDYAKGAHRCEAGERGTVAVREPTERNWGFAVLDSAETPGGRAPQVASAMVAALGVLGVKASVVCVSAGPGGAVQRLDHDPLVPTSTGFDPKRDGGLRAMAFVAVPVDTSRDGGPIVHDTETLVFDPPVRGGRLGVFTERDLKRTGRTRKLPVRDGQPPSQCRGGHPLNAPVVTPSQTLEFVGSSGVESNLALEGGGLVTLTLAELQTEKADGGKIQGRPNRTYRDYAVPLKGFHLFVDGLFRGRLALKEPAKIWLEPGRHAVALREVEGLRGVSWQGKVAVAASSPAKGEPPAALGVFPLVGRSLSVHECQPAASIDRSVEAEGPIFAEFLLSPDQSTRLEVAVKIDAGVEVRSRLLEPGTSSGRLALGPTTGGRRAVSVRPVNLAWPWKRWSGTLVVWGSRPKNAATRACTTCGAQPRWAYKCGKCGGALDGERPSGTHRCGEPLDAPVAAVMSPCPNCCTWVGEDDADCWRCGAKLTGSGQAAGRKAP